MPSWRWDAVHRAIFPHQGLDSIAPLRWLLSRSVPNGGDWSTVNVGSVSTGQPYHQRSVAGHRTIIDLSPANDSRFIIDLGQSGHPLSEHYDDFLEDWQAVRHRQMRMERAEIEKGAIGRFRLTPKNAGLRPALPVPEPCPRFLCPCAPVVRAFTCSRSGSCRHCLRARCSPPPARRGRLRQAAAGNPGLPLLRRLASPPRRSLRDSCSAPPATGAGRRRPHALLWSSQTGSCHRRSCRSAL